MKKQTTYTIDQIPSDSPNFVARINTHKVTEMRNGKMLRVWRSTLAEMEAIIAAVRG